MATVSAHDVAAYILKKTGPMSAMKLQKLLYYAQAWSLVWDETPLFKERIEAWINGPVVPNIYQDHRGRFMLSEWDGNPQNLNQDQRETVDAIIAHYGSKSAQWLSDLTHLEAPWREARQGISPDERGDTEITLAAMHEYYSGLQ